MNQPDIRLLNISTDIIKLGEAGAYSGDAVNSIRSKVRGITVTDTCDGVMLQIIMTTLRHLLNASTEEDRRTLIDSFAHKVTVYKSGS